MNTLPEFTGVVRRFSQTNGWGFIAPTGGGRDVFVHFRDVEGGKLLPGDQVSYSTKRTPKGIRAVKVAVLSSYEITSENWMKFIGPVPRKE